MRRPIWPRRSRPNRRIVAPRRGGMKKTSGIVARTANAGTVAGQNRPRGNLGSLRRGESHIISPDRAGHFGPIAPDSAFCAPSHG